MSDQNSPHPGTKITQKTPTVAYRDKITPVAEFDVNSKAAYDQMVIDFPNAWDEYFGGSGGAPAYTPEDAVKLQEAVRFWQYMNIGEDILEEPTNQTEADAWAAQNRWHSEHATTFAPKAGDAAYENPEAFYDPEVYDRQVVPDGDGNRDPQGLERLPLDSAQTISAHDPKDDVFDTEYLGMTEYETTHRSPANPYEWGGEYAVGKNVYGKGRGHQG